MHTDYNVPLAPLTTLGVGGPAARVIEATTEGEVVEIVSDVSAHGEPLLVLGGGSNLLVPDEGWPGTVLRVAIVGVVVTRQDGRVRLKVGAGEEWDRVVERCADEGWAGLEALSGIPGMVGATPIQNVGAYGQEVSHTLARVRTWDRQAGEFRTFTADQCGFGYRDSIFKQSRAPQQATGRFVVLETWFQFRLASLSEPVRYGQLAARLGVELGARVPAREVRQAVLELRASKGMVLDAADHDTWSAGSFFTNPILDAAITDQLPAQAPRFAQPDGRVKTSAAWLIDHSGFNKGYPGEGAARLSSKHVLALTNQGGASAAEVVALARQVRAGVHDRFGIWLVPEPVLVGLEL